MKQLVKDINDNKLVIIIVILYLVIMQVLFKTVCPFYAIFHIPCPGCGLTRASLLLFIGRFRESFSYNPTAIFWIISISFFLVDRYIKKIKFRPFPIMFFISSFITLFWYVVKLFI